VADTPLSLRVDPDEPSFIQHTQVFGDLRLAKLQAFCNIPDGGPRGVSQQLDNSQAVRFCEGTQDYCIHIEEYII
jgi:hypothetical protein